MSLGHAALRGGEVTNRGQSRAEIDRASHQERRVRSRGKGLLIASAISAGVGLLVGVPLIVGGAVQEKRALRRTPKVRVVFTGRKARVKLRWTF
jgi:hypothetical protein